MLIVNINRGSGVCQQLITPWGSGAIQRNGVIQPGIAMAGGRVTKYYTQVRVILTIGTCNVSCKNTYVTNVIDASLVIAITIALLPSLACTLLDTLGLWCNGNWVSRLHSRDCREGCPSHVLRKVKGLKLLSSCLCL